MRVFADSNFLISALATRGLSNELLELILVSGQISICQQVVEEVLEKLQRKFKLPEISLLKVKEYLGNFELIEVSRDFTYQLRDKDDEAILSAAVQSQCAYLVTGDKDLLVEKDHIKEIQIVTPRELWTIIKS